MPRVLRVVGLYLCPAAAPLVLRLLWEMAALTWQRGPQMVGFTLLHVHPVPAIIAALCWMAVAAWLIAALSLRAIGRISFSRLDCVVVCIERAACIRSANPVSGVENGNGVTTWDFARSIRHVRLGCVRR